MQRTQQRLVLEKQESLAVDRFSRNGVTKDLYFVAKNIPFNVHVYSTLNLNTHPLGAKLFYDFDLEEDQKEVETLKVDPLQYTAHVNDTGDRAVVEVRISVLSSQHEGAFFRIKLSTNDPKTGEVSTFTQPLKVISKRQQVRRMLEKNELQATEPLPTPKRTSSEMITEALTRLEEQQREQAKLLKMLVAQKAQAVTEQQPIKQQTNDELDFETAFKRFLQAYQKLPSEERPSKIRKVVKQVQTNTSESQSLHDFVNTYAADFMPERNFMNALMEMPSGLGLDNSINGINISSILNGGASQGLSSSINGEQNTNCLLFAKGQLEQDDVYAQLFADSLTPLEPLNSEMISSASS